MNMADSVFLREPVKGIQIRRFKKELPTFITEERAQKFDLLVHLVANLKQPLIVCGPVGIGKTTLLTELKQYKADEWPIVTLSGTDRLSFELVQELLWQKIRQQSLEFETASLTYALQQLEKLNLPLLLIVDDAGKLVSGLMTSLAQYAVSYPCIRLIFAMTNDELEQKHHTEHVSHEWHFIEIPTLSLIQTKEYLQELLAKPDQKNLLETRSAKVEKSVNNAVKDVMVKQIYKKTNGVPGKIVEELPHFLGGKTMKGSSWIYILVFACALTVGVAALLWKSNAPVQDKMQIQVNSSESSAPLVAPLNIPGQVHEESKKTTDATGASIVTPLDKNSSLPQLPEIKKSDYYTGYARVREKDALDEYQASSQSVSNPETVAEQPKVEIISPEPVLPTPVTIAVPKVMDATSNAEHFPESKPESAQAPDVKSSAVSTQASITDKTTSKIKPVGNELSKLALHEQQKQPINTVKKNTIIKLDAKSSPNSRSKLENADKSASNKIEPQKPKNLNTVEQAEKFKAASVTKIEPREVNLRRQAEVPEEKLNRLANQESLDNDVIKDSTVLSSDNTNKVLKNELPNSPGKSSEFSHTAKLEEHSSTGVDSSKLNLTEKSKKTALEKKDHELMSPAKLGVVMKYKSEEGKLDKNSDAGPDAKSEETSAHQQKSKTPSSSLAKTKIDDENVDANGKKSSNGSYTLQVMVFSQQQTLQNFMAKHGGLGANLRYVTSQKDGVERYVVTYGTFSSLAEANKAKQRLPADFKQALARKR